MKYERSPFDKVLRFRTRCGSMAIRYAGFFPCSVADIKKLLKIMCEANDREEVEEMRGTMIEACEERIRENRQALKEHADAYFENKQKSEDLKRQLKEGKYPNGVPIPQDARKELRKLQRLAGSVAAEHTARFEYKTALIRKLEKNVETMKEFAL